MGVLCQSVTETLRVCAYFQSGPSPIGNSKPLGFVLIYSRVLRQSVTANPKGLRLFPVGSLRIIGKPTNPWHRFPGDLDAAPGESSARRRTVGKPTVRKTLAYGQSTARSATLRSTLVIRTSTARSATLRSTFGKPTVRQTSAGSTGAPLTLTLRLESQALVDGQSVSRLSVRPWLTDNR